ncbi:M48 family metallopeptidase [Halosimplex aquaticum]|uniref:M48 family metallopeptidase n=1 Tax=Halosimplex aquaticum TaxID=3026162 RepID=A0ABD5Y1H3_9EURY|nr:M48 family metalloprotease [Halosimplex aquaticum]
MSLTHRLDRAAGLPAAYRLIDAAFLAALVVALAACYATGMSLAGVAAVVLAGFGLEYAVSGVVTDGIFRGVEWADEAPPHLRRVVAEVAADFGVAVPTVVVDPESPSGVNVIGDGERTVLVVSGALVETLDERTVRAVVAHELAHVALGHLRQMPVRVAITHVVGLAAFWVLALRHLPPQIAMLGAGVFLVTGVARSNGINAVVYVAASAGVVVLMRALAARASRLEECHADDVAVEHAGETEFCTGLYAVGSVGAVDDAVAGAAPFAARRTRLDRLTAVHPSIEHRLARHGVVPDDVADGIADERVADD